MAKMTNADKPKEGGSYEVLPAGMHVARCYGMIDLGNQKNEWKGEVKFPRKITLLFEVPGERIEIDGKDLPKGITYGGKFGVTWSLVEKSNFGQFMKNWLGKSITMNDFSDELVVGREAMINVVHNQKGDNVYANIMSASPLPSQMTCPPQENESVVYLIGEGMSGDWDKVPEYLQDTIKQSTQFQEEMNEFDKFGE